MANSFLTDKDPLQIDVPVADLLDHPGGARARQLLFGDLVFPLDEMRDHVLVKAARDGYVGYLASHDVGAASQPTHRVIGLATHLYEAPDFKTRDVATLSFGAHITVTAETDRFYQTHTGQYVPQMHLARESLRFNDPAAVAELFLGTPYLWGGNSRLGLDCSGLVQTACLACGVPCPGDSGEQSLQTGVAIDREAPLMRGDLVFWDGHVGMMVSDRLMIHANAHHMATVFEPLEEAVERIAAAGHGQITKCRRPILETAQPRAKEPI
ncbi:MAG: NlpC/P60 family protein [Pseudomonadota bacterium]